MVLKKSKSRRSFLKLSAGAAAGMMAAKIQANPSGAPMKEINPKISNLDVVCIKDPKMVTGLPTKWNSIADQNETVDSARIKDNIDRMAMVLAKKGTPGDAWKTIFQLPQSKPPSAVKVAIKVNCKTRSKTPKINPRLPVLDKLCEALNGLGIPYGNIILFDADDEEANVLYAEYVGNGLPSGVIVSKRNQALGGHTPTPVPPPWDQNTDCCTDLVNGNIDILLNVTVNKGSHGWTGPATLSMKNHYGTFKTANKKFHKLDFLIGMNKADVIIGGTPVRQQLCFVDSIWSCTTGPSDPPDRETHMLIMGTCSPVVDYLIVKKIREPLMQAKHKAEIIDRYISDFGYSATDMKELIMVDPEMPLKIENGERPISPIPRKSELLLSLPQRSANSSISFSLLSEIRPVFVHIYSVRGRLIKALPVPRASGIALNASWDGLDQSGKPVRAGTYLAALIQNGRKATKKIRLL